MKILYYHQYFTSPTLGGAIRSYEFARALVKRGHQVTMVCGGADEKFNLPRISKNVNKGVVDGIEVIQVRVNTTNVDGIYKRALDFLRYGVLGVKFMVKEDYDVLFATSTPLTAGIPGIIMKWLGKKSKFIFEVRDLWPELPKALGMRNPLLLGGMSVLEKLSYNKADACIGLSPGICEGVRKKTVSSKPIKMIPNGCDLELFSKSGGGEEYIIPGAEIDSDDVVAVFTGAHGVANGLDAVLDMAKILQNKNENQIKILFVGRGKEKSRLMKRANDERITNCIFLNRVSKYELNKIMNRADIGLMVLKNIPAFYYGTSPNKFFDYISSSLPVVNNYPGWLADMIEASGCGVAVPPESPNAFAESLIYLAHNPEFRREMGVKARTLAESKFSRSNLADQFVGFIEEIHGK